MEKRRSNELPTLVIRRVIRAKIDQVFEAWSKPEIMSQWFFPGEGKAVITNDFRLGGSYENKMILEAGTDGHQGCGSPSAADTYIHFGEYLEISPPVKIVFTWNSHLIKDSRVTIDLRDLGDSTELTLTHTLLGTEEIKQKHSGGWEGCLAKLVNYFE